MGLMDKVKAQATVLADKAQTGMQQGQTKLQEMQTGKQVDHLLRELGAYVFLGERDRARPDSEARVAAIMSQLDALEAAGTSVTISDDPSVIPPEGAVPRPHVEPDPGAAAASAPPDAPPPPPAAGTIPKSGGGLPGQ
jgi:hypothetical protein